MTKKKSKLLSLREYAKHKGLNISTVVKYARDGKITYVKSGQKKLVDPDVVDKELEDNTDESKKTSEENDDEQETESSEGKGPTFASARTSRETYQALLKQLEYEERKKVLISADDVQKDAFNCARIVRDQILGIPDRISHIVASETDPDKVYKILSDSLYQALEELSRDDKE